MTSQFQFLLPLLGVLTALLVAASYVRAHLRLRHIPGPPVASFSYLWMLRNSLRGRQAEVYRGVSRRYGPLARIGPADLLTDDPDVIRRMSMARGRYGRSSWYDAMRMDPYQPSLFALTDTAAHDRLKARLAPGYGGGENPRVEDEVDAQLASLLALIRRKYVSAEDSSSSSGAGNWRPMDFALVVNYFTLDSITQIAYGRAFGYVESDSDVFGYLAAAERQVPVLALLGEVPWLSRIAFSAPVLRLLGPKLTDKKGMGRMMAVAQKVVGERFGPGAVDRRDMLGSFVRHGLSRRHCEAEVLFQIIAGSDTTATAIRGTMLHLLSTPFAYFRLREEIDAAVAAGKVSSPIRVDEAKELEYLQAVIYEGLRMNIPFSGLVMKQVPVGGDTICGKFVPGGTRVAHSTLSAERSTAVFGADADLFRPGRWLGLDGARRRDMAQTVELVFGYGRFGCSGKNIAFMELHKAYFELLRYFDFQLVDVKNPMTTKNNNVFFQKNMWVKVTERTRS